MTNPPTGRDEIVNVQPIPALLGLSTPQALSLRGGSGLVKPESASWLFLDFSGATPRTTAEYLIRPWFAGTVQIDGHLARRTRRSIKFTVALARG